MRPISGTVDSSHDVPEFSENRRALLKGGTAVFFLSSVGMPCNSRPVPSNSDRAPIDDALAQAFDDPPAEAGLGAYWYWLAGAVTRDGISADLEAMRDNGITTAMLFAIGASTHPPLINPPADALTPNWWSLVEHAVDVAERLGMNLALNICDGWATASGPWITPELSMQVVTWTEARVSGHATPVALAQPESRRGYYRDIAVLAFPWPQDRDDDSVGRRPRIATSLPITGGSLERLIDPTNDSEVFDTTAAGHIDYIFESAFTLRSVTVRTPSPWGYSPGVYRAANSLEVQASDDGVGFRTIGCLEYPQHGWQTDLTTLTHALPNTTARIFRFIHHPREAGPYRENFDFGQDVRLRMHSLVLSAKPEIHQIVGKTASQWSISRRTTATEAPTDVCVDPSAIVDISQYLREDGTLDWSPPPGRWRILRLGATTNGRENSAAGGAQGLEVDRLNAAAVTLQFDRWFGSALDHIGPSRAGRVLHTVHVDSWEASGQNWSPCLLDSFRRLRGYDLRPWLALFAGVPVGNAATSEAVLHDLRRTIAELTQSEFFETISRLAHARGCRFSGEPASPTFAVDGLRWADATDMPMGEFWLRTPRNDKPTDIADATSGGHIYGKRIIAAESFTENEIVWDEHPGMLKALGDRNYCRGINRLMLHVYTAQPFTDRRPGMTLNGIGTVFGRTQTWWHQSKGWFDYMRRCQAVLQKGRPVADVGVFIGEEIPSRALLPSQLEATLPSGYRYDSINRDALVRLADVEDGYIILPGGARYRLLILPSGARYSGEFLHALNRLLERGATVLGEPTVGAIGVEQDSAGYAKLARRLWDGKPSPGDHRIGLGRLLWGSGADDVLRALGAQPDVLFSEGPPLDWTHREGSGWHAYFIANSTDLTAVTTLSLRGSAGTVELWCPTGGERAHAPLWRVAAERTELPLTLGPSASVIVVLRATDSEHIVMADLSTEAIRLDTDRGGPLLVGFDAGNAQLTLRNGERVSLAVPAPPRPIVLDGPWTLSFSGWRAPPDKFAIREPRAWTGFDMPRVRFHAGSGHYATTVKLPPHLLKHDLRWSLKLSTVREIAQIRINGHHVSTLWTPPFLVDVTRWLNPGDNRIEIIVTNVWHNRIVGDRRMPEARRIAWVYPSLRGGQEWLPSGTAPLIPAGLEGPVTLIGETTRRVPL